VRAAIERATGAGDAVRRARELSARTVIFDVEPLVAYWDGGREALDQGIVRVFSEVSALPTLQVLCFATNSPRRCTWRRRASRCGPRRTGVSHGPAW
jgi:hypothetical protein